MQKNTLKLTLGVMLFALGALNSTSYASGTPSAADYAYHVQPGDNLSKLTRDVLESHTGWDKVAKYNKLPNAHLLYPGEVLHIPYAWLKNSPAAAHIETLTGDVKLNGNPARVGDAVSSNAVLETQAGGGARMRLPDGSTLNVLESTHIEAKEITRKKKGDFFNTVFKLVAGRIDAVKNAFPAERSPLLIQGMHGTIGVRGTHFRMAQDGDNTLAEIEHGKVGFAVGEQAVALSGGEGSVADGVKPAAVIPLLSAPVVMNLPGQFENILVRVDLQEMQGAQAFRGEVAREEDFANILAQNTYQGTQVRIANLADGTYWLRVRAIDVHGLQGLESRTRFVLKAHPVAPLLMGTNDVELAHGIQPDFSWAEVDEAQSYRFQIARDQEFKDLALKQDNIKATRFSFAPGQNLQIGQYYWRVASVKGEADQGPWSEVRKLRVLPDSATAPALKPGRMIASWQDDATRKFEFQMADSKDFSDIKLNLTLNEPKIDIEMPAVGKYFFRIRTVDADGYIGPWTPTQSFVSPARK